VAWITVQITQNGNENRLYRMTAFSGMTVFDSIGAGPEVGNSAVSISRHDASPGPSHLVGIQTLDSPTGGGAIAFRIRGGLQA